ncbi:unnamed protein product [Callosobruchus maculatus]|uniref:Uncharacterized protein n=1 Tax=Callosobruchus maculatus TaxID=64391 RepID=A0A653DPZ2_CALMS|nr:unnamed protein product [Callosobruchus maculatus]
MLWSRHILVPVECAVESHFHSYPNCRSKNRGTQNFELRPIDFISRLLSCSLSTIITLVL